MAMKDYDSWDKSRLIEEVRRLSARKKYGLVWEDKPEDVVEKCKMELPVLEEIEERAIEIDPSLPTNFIIEGDNYHALSVLNYTHAGKADVIYIDPPYNTGAKDWKYNNDYVDGNDSYRHSKWLSMMEKRLVTAKRLLKEDGVLVCAIDENERDHLGLLLEGIFPDSEIHCITIVHNPRGIQGGNFSYTHEYAFFVFRAGLKAIGARKIREEDVDWRNLRDNGGESLRTDARNCFYPIIVEDERVIGFGDVVEAGSHPTGQTVQKGERYYIYPIDPQGIERKWRYARQSVEDILPLLRAKKRRSGFDIELGKDFGTVRTVWQDSRYDSNEYGTKLIKSIVPSAAFNFPKSIWNTYDCIAPLVNTKKHALIVDFFAGSGTTGHAVMELNKEDGGNRKFILCTNNENKIAEEVTYPRIKGVIDGYADVKGIPANVRYFKTAFVPRSDVSDDTRRSLISKSTEMLCVKESTFKKVADNKKFKIYRNQEQATGILFDLDAIDEFKEKLDATELPASIYVFSLTSDNFAEDFENLTIKHRIRPIPEGILEVYRKIFA